jgi:hypothetical protein
MGPGNARDAVVSLRALHTPIIEEFDRDEMLQKVTGGRRAFNGIAQF